MITRRSLFAGLGALLAAPAVVKVAALIPPLEAARVRSVNYPTISQITREAMHLFRQSNEFFEHMKVQYPEEFGSEFGESAKIGSQLRMRHLADWNRVFAVIAPDLNP